MSERPQHPFHLAFPVDDLEAARRFYTETLGCRVGREAERWIDFDFFGHQITAHLCDEPKAAGHNPVDGDSVPVRHFGIILDMARWEELKQRLSADPRIKFIIEPKIRFAGLPGEQATMFFRDPAGNAIELKAFADTSHIFRR